jgi:glycosyltransferase involved in cell wall biosynthesis
LRILQLTQLYPPVVGGEERHVRNLAVALAARGHDVHVATQAAGGEPPQDPGVRVHRLDGLGQHVPALYPTADRPLALPVPDPLTARDLARVVREVRPDVIHVHNWVVASLTAIPAAYRVPVVHSLHDYGHVCATKRLVRDGLPCSGPAPRKCLPCTSEHYGRGRGPAVYAAVQAGLPLRRRLVDVFTPVSRYVAEHTGVLDDGSQVEVVPNFVPDELLTRGPVPRDPALPERPYLFFAGDLTRQKGLATLLEAHRSLDPATRPDLVCVGRPGDDLSELTGHDGVHLHHHWSHDRVVSGFRHALAAALPSEWPDPCPTTVLEAMALGTPLVTTHEGGIADMAVDGRSALVVPPRSPAVLAAALTRLVDDPELRARLRAGAVEDVRPFTQGRVAAQLEGIYARLGAGTRSAGPSDTV